MASLSSASEGLVASLEKAASELSWIQHRLEDEFSRSCRKGEINTLQLLTRLNKLWRCAATEGGRADGHLAAAGSC